MATLFPPFRWGEEKLRTERERRMLTVEFNINATEVLPIKKYDFLFSDSKKQFLVSWGWDNQQKKSIPNYMMLERQLIVTELLLEYFLAFVIACVVYFLFQRKKET